jgi:hypothetical protein
VLGIFGQYNRAPVISALILFILPAYFFNRIKPNLSFILRFTLFGGLVVLIAGIIYFFAVVERPFYHLTLTSYTACLVMSIIFIIMIAHDIFASFVNMVSQGNSKSLRHLSLISVFYMGNLIITCMHEMGVIAWNFFYIDLYLLLTVSAVLGVWGFRQREVLYGNIVSFAPFGGYFFLSLATICFATTGQLLANNNDPALKVIRDAIIFSHTGYGIIFLTYIFSNFVLMLARNLPVYKVLYKPTRMPYFTYRFAGMIAMLAFAFYSNWRTYVYNGVAGFYNTAGDLHMMLGNEAFAESFYEQGRSQGFQNNRSNYALATMKSARLNIEDAHENYRLANAKRPSIYSLTNAGNIYLWDNDIFGAIREYQRANTILNGASIVDNNLGFAYAQVHNLDSSLFYLNRARNNSFTRTSAEMNFFALASMELIPLDIDSVLSLFNNAGPAVVGNALALSTLQRQVVDRDLHPLANERLNLYTATLLNNYVIKYAKSLDTAFIARAYRVASDSLNSDYSEAIKASLAFAYYLKGNVTKALEILAELAYITQRYQGQFNYIMGLWALEQHNPKLASQYFTFADTYDYKEARFYNAIALTEDGSIGEAVAAWNAVAQGSSEEQRVIATQLIEILQMPSSAAKALGDAEKYQYCRYRSGIRDTIQFNVLVSLFESDNFRAQALLDLSRKFLDAGELVPASKYLNRIQGLTLTDQRLYDEIRLLELLMMAYKGDATGLKKYLASGMTLKAENTLENLLITTLVAESEGDTTSIEKNYEILGSHNPYLEEAVIAAASYFKRRSDTDLKSYSILAEAIQINANSIRLLEAYTNEAAVQGFDEYAASTYERLVDLRGY